MIRTFQDATDEINAYHSDQILQNKLPLYYFGDVNNKDSNQQYKSLIPPIQFYNPKNDLNNNRVLTPELLLANDTNYKISLSEQRHIAEKYRKLYSKLRSLGKLYTFKIQIVKLSFT